MPATLTAEYDLTGLSGATLYDKVKAVLTASGATLHDDYLSGSIYSLVERVSIPGSPDVYARWMVTGTSIYGPQLYLSWNVTSHVGVNPLGPQGTSLFASNTPYLRAYTSAGSYRLLVFVSGNNLNYSMTALGWLAPSTQPSGWNTAGVPFVAAVGSSTVFNPLTNLTFPTLAGTAGTSSTTMTVPPLDGASIGRYPPVPGLDWGLYEVPGDFALISGRSTSDAGHNRDTTYAVTVAGQSRTYQLLGLTNGLAFCIRTA